ncbi:MAG: flagellar brake protein [Thermodesulfobacteriota bacterium]
MALFKKSSSKNKSGQAAESTGWVPQEGGYEVTSSPELIKNILTQLKNDRRLLLLAQKDYQSGGTILVEFDQNQILVDKPQDFPGDQTKALIVFRDADRIRHHFQCNVVSVAGDTIYLQFPQKLVKLQRRQYYRVELPSGSIVQCRYEGQNYLFYAKDVSAGGMLLFSNSFQGIEEPGSILEDIVLAAPASGSDDRQDGSGGESFQVGKGEVVRRFYQQESSLYYLGIRFISDDTEKKGLMAFIRQRELEILRKGIK